MLEVNLAKIYHIQHDSCSWCCYLVRLVVIHCCVAVISTFCRGQNDELYYYTCIPYVFNVCIPLWHSPWDRALFFYFLSWQWMGVVQTSLVFATSIHFILQVKETVEGFCHLPRTPDTSVNPDPVSNILERTGDSLFSQCVVASVNGNRSYWGTSGMMANFMCHLA